VTPKSSWPGVSHDCPVPQSRLQCGTKPLLLVVITGLVPVIHAFLRPRPGHVDGRNKSGHDSVSRSENFECPATLYASLNRTALGASGPSTISWIAAPREGVDTRAKPAHDEEKRRSERPKEATP
jgi:hypothetical protein